MKTVAILQSNYIPWKGYFDIIRAVDEFILYDTAQYTRQDWRNRNRIKTARGVEWLTIPVKVDNLYSQTISATQVSGAGWAAAHWRKLTEAYRHAPYFNTYAPVFEQFYLETQEAYLSLINYRLLTIICTVLGIKTPITWSADYDLSVIGPTDRLVDLCRQAGASHYLSGPSAEGLSECRCFQGSKYSA